MREDTLTVLIVLAHPDDETFGLGGTMAWLSDRGVAVHILLATRGEAGLISEPDMDTAAIRARLGDVREAEARAAAEVVGARAIEFLGYPDGGLAEANAGELTRLVALAIRRLRPAVVITFGPEGIYCHPDHVTIGEVTTEAFGLAADPTVDIGGLRPHAADRLFFQVLTAEVATMPNRDRGPVMLGDQPMHFVGYTEQQITTRLDVTAYVERKLAAIACHRTQTAMRMDEMRAWLTSGPLVESLILARQRVPAAPGLETDLLAGLG